jgi:ferredoxin
VQFLETSAVDALVLALRGRGYRPLGPKLRDGTVVYDEIESAADLPVGWKDEQSPGSYRMIRRDDGALFGFVPGAQSWKQFLFPPESTLFRVDLRPGSVSIREDRPEDGHQAFVGVRPCELRAIAILDQVFLDGPHADPVYRGRRERTIIVAVNCADPGKTCFCTSVGTGPGVDGGYDLALTEVCEPGRHYFCCESGSDRGAELLSDLPHRPAREDERMAAESVRRRAAGRMGRSLEIDGLRELIHEKQEHAHWELVATRCLACGNCTMVCPTCFCSDVIDRTSLDGTSAERRRRWDSCFNGEFSYIHGGRIRQSGAARYRQWMTHKLASWIDQFGQLGCVGCGRCVTWCPVGIDITEEAATLRGSAEAGKPAGE